MTLGSKIWVNGAVVVKEEAKISATDRGFTLGDGLFETMLWTGKQIRFLDDHLARLTKSAMALGLTMPFEGEAIKAGLEALAQDAQGQTAALRLTLTRGTGPRGLAIADTTTPLLLATIAPFEAPASLATLKTVAIKRNAGAPSARYKTLSYLDNVMALQEARALGGNEAIMLGTTGFVACASSANIVIAYQGQNLTPALDDGALPGIVRGRLLAAGVVKEANVDAQMMAHCTNCALTNALMSVRSVGAIDGRILADQGDFISRLKATL
jgi:branched-chain amino acid aminotransferase